MRVWWNCGGKPGNGHWMDLSRSMNQLDVHFDRVYFESEVEEIGKDFVQDNHEKNCQR